MPRFASKEQVQKAVIWFKVLLVIYLAIVGGMTVAKLLFGLNLPWFSILVLCAFISLMEWVKVYSIVLVGGWVVRLLLALAQPTETATRPAVTSAEPS